MEGGPGLGSYGGVGTRELLYGGMGTRELWRVINIKLK